MIRIAQIGCGYWGPNFLRNFQQNPNCEVIAVADPSPTSQVKIRALYPEIQLLDSPATLFESSEVDAFVIATPARFHHRIAKSALEAGKDVLVEKPLALTSADGEELLEISSQNQRILMVGHILEYHPAIIKIRKILADGELGKLQHIRSTRLSLGRFRHEENVLWSFAPHDIAMIQRLAGNSPDKISAIAQTHLQQGIPDTVHADLQFPGNLHAHLHVSWQEPVKEQKLTVVGAKAMATYDDVKKQLLLHPHQIDRSVTPPSLTKAQPEEIPFAPGEPLARECQAFLDAIESRNPPLTDGKSALQVLQTIETIQRQIGN